MPLCSSFEKTNSHLPRARKILCTGNPLRPEIVQQVSSPGEIAGRKSLLILGGSQGSTTVNEAVLNGARAIVESQPESPLRSWRVIHQTGLGETDHVAEAWKSLGIEATVESFFNDLPDRYAQAGLVISRSGATTLAELACLNLPSILLPYEHARDDHQTANARVFEAAGAARLIGTREADTTKQLAMSLAELTEDSSRREAMSKNCQPLARSEAADLVAEFVCSEAGLTAQS